MNAKGKRNEVAYDTGYWMWRKAIFKFMKIFILWSLGIAIVAEIVYRIFD